MPDMGDSAERPSKTVEHIPSLTNLPPLPAIAMQILRMLSRAEVETKELARLISADPALSTELLALANSALFGFPTRIRSIRQATTLLGTERVKALALTIGLKVYVTGSLRLPELKACWIHSLACALLADQLTPSNGTEKDLAYTAGLLHDIGRLAMGAADPHRYAHFLSEVRGSEAALARERRVFGLDHCEAGRMLVESWKLPSDFAEVTAHHHRQPDDGEPSLVTVVYYSCRLADILGFGAVQEPEARSFAELVERLPERMRAHCPQDPAALTQDISAKLGTLQ
jgi:putative nucleotidyltransferase with HDIG domain